nr:MAG TPA: Sporulation protein Cse60 [Caudoviricetes sp.]
MKTYRMVVFEGYLEDITRKFNAWASDDDGIDIIRIEFCPGRFTKDGEQGLIVIYKKDVYKTKKANSDVCKPVVERPMPKEPISSKSAEELETLKAIQRNMAEISNSIAFGNCSRCWNGVRGLNRDMATLKNMLEER